MTFRYARHTSDLKKIEKFYVEMLGLKKLGAFEGHDHYDGIFLGHENTDWHLEFTASKQRPTNQFDDDDILVFYVNSELELSKIKARLDLGKVKLEKPKNPYWAKNGIMISDPDKFHIVFSIKHLSFHSNDSLTSLVQSKNIETWSDLITYVRMLPYGRNANREDLSLVLKEGKGTCSSKHAFLKKIADLNGFSNVKLILGLYKMNHLNTPKIGNIISDSGLKYIPEAHCYLKLNNNRIDITQPSSEFENLKKDIIEEIEIKPEQVNTYKVAYHKSYLQKWIKEGATNLGFDEVWKIRESCIKKLEG